MKTETTIQNQSLPARTPNLFRQILSPKAMIVAAVVATVWIYFLGFQTVRLVEVALRRANKETRDGPHSGVTLTGYFLTAQPNRLMGDRF